MTTLEHAEAQALEAAAVAETKRPRRRVRGGNWWRYLIALLAILFALFPIAYVVSAAFNPVDSLSGSGLIPEKVTLDNFRAMLSGHPGKVGSSEEATVQPYKNWYVNMIVVAGLTAILSVFSGALAAYAFARYRFKGRRMGMMTLLLIQMFPTFLAVVAVYLIVLRVGNVFPLIGLDTRSGLILVYLGGVLGVNTWLMKGFMDSIPDSLDESARVDGATPSQVFWAIILPLAAPVLAVIALLSYIATINEYVVASVLLSSKEKWTMSVGLFSFIQDKYAQQWGAFCAGVVLAAIPVVIIFFFLQRFIAEGLTRGAVKG